MTTVAIVQARTSSSRLPGKVLLPINGKPLILYQLDRIAKSRTLDKIYLATSTDSSDNNLAAIVEQAGYSVFRGSLNDVLHRYYCCSVEANASTVVRLTGDCPFTDPLLVDEVVNSFISGGWDYLSNAADPSQLSVPDGFDVEIFKAGILERAVKEASLPSEREHVTPWFRSKASGLNWAHYCHQPFRRFYRLTVDDPLDLVVVRAICAGIVSPNSLPNIDDIISFLDENPEVSALNSATIRNQGYLTSLEKELNPTQCSSGAASKGQQLWQRSKSVIPGGNMLLSKRPEMFLPEHWPSYFSRAKGCTVWDLDNLPFYDMSIMGIGTNTLGYGHPEVDGAVSASVSSGNMCTLNCPEEVLLAERLVDIHPWADMVRYARSGGEANAIAIRIARAATGRDTIAICGYHGWHDWYLATNLQNESGLEQHLLPGLEPKGVPRALAGTVQPFSFNRFDQLEEIASNHSLAAVKMEVQRNFPPENDFLQKVRDLCTRLGIVLIFDECTSGFRETFGGLHLKYGVNPDMAMFGKALGNGYAITAVIGQRSVMEAAQSTFISSTFWTERIGPSAALKTLEVMEREQSWKRITEIGMSMRNSWQSLADKYSLKIVHNGIPALTGFSFQSQNALKYKTLITQEMLKKGFLASTSFYASLAHASDIVSCYLSELDSIFSLISECENGRSIEDLLAGPICHSGFTRLN